MTGTVQGVNAALAAAATLVAVCFAFSTLDRWLRRGRPHDLAWSVSLALFAAGAGALWWAETRGWSLGSFRLFYLCGAVLNVPWLALGTVYLLAGRAVGDAVRWWLVLLSGLSAGVVMFAPTRTAVSGKDLPTGKEVFGVAPRVLAATGSGVAARTRSMSSAASRVRREPTSSRSAQVEPGIASGTSSSTSDRLISPRGRYSASFSSSQSPGET